MNPMYYHFLFKAQHEDLVQKAEQQLFLKDLPDKQKFPDQIMTKVGELLIQIGSRLKHLEAPQSPSLNSRNIV